MLPNFLFFIFRILLFSSLIFLSFYCYLSQGLNSISSPRKIFSNTATFSISYICTILASGIVDYQVQNICYIICLLTLDIFSLRMIFFLSFIIPIICIFLTEVFTLSVLVLHIQSCSFS